MAWLHPGFLMACSPRRQSMSSLSGPLQVVPDIDDQVANPEHPQEVTCAWPQPGGAQGFKFWGALGAVF